jgi:hypothetical protein
MCYTVYTHQRDMQRELSFYVPLIGGRPRYSKMWASIQADMSRPHDRHYHIRYGLAALMFVVALGLPWTLGKQPTALAAVPTQPSPAQTASHTPGVGGVRVRETMAPLLYSTVMTPEADLQPALPPDGTP